MEITAIFDHLLTAEAIANNVDLLTEILLRVPAKSLVRFKCVSKDWLSFISDSKFSNNHMRKNLNTTISGLYIESCPFINLNTKSQDGLPKLDFLTTSSQMEITVLHSCNGLTLCLQGEEIIVCNITTQKFTVIPSPPKSSARLYADKFLVVNPVRLPHYKVVLIINIKGSLKSTGIFSLLFSYEIDIYSSENAIWNKKIFSELENDAYTNKVLCDGAIYWITDCNNLEYFDVEREDFTIIQMPREPVIILEYDFVSWFGEYAGNLLLVQQTNSSNETQFRVLEMDMHNYSWTTKYNVNLDPIKDTLYGNNSYYEGLDYLRMMELAGMTYGHSVYVLCFNGGDGKETIGNESLALLLVINGKIISYDLDNNYLEVLQDLPSKFHGTFFFSGTRCVHKIIESLATIT